MQNLNIKEGGDQEAEGYEMDVKKDVKKISWTDRAMNENVLSSVNKHRKLIETV